MSEQSTFVWDYRPAWQRKLEADRLTLQLRSRSRKRADSGRRPITESPLFGGPAQQELFTCPACGAEFSRPGYPYTETVQVCHPCGAIAEADPVDERGTA
jgi:hypothetical protein